MSMKILKILILIVLVCGSSFSARAQVDCLTYGLKFFVQDESGKIIENAKPQLVGLDEKSKLPNYVKLIRLDDAYFFASSAGASVNSNFQVIISADGFGTYQQKVNFLSCKIENYNVKLKRITDKQNSSILSGIVYDAVKAIVPATKLIAKHNDGRIFETISDDEGVYKIQLPFGKYTLEFSRNGFKNYIVENFENTFLTDESFDVDFIVGHCSDCNGAIYGERDENEEKPTVVDYKKIKNKRKN